MACACDDPCLFYDTEQRTSRKERGCEECHSVIPIGSQYIRMVGRSERGGFWTFVMCMACDADWREIRHVFCEAGDEDEMCTCLGKLSENVAEAVDADHLEPTAPLAVRWLGEPEADPVNGATSSHHPRYDERQMSLGF